MSNAGIQLRSATPGDTPQVLALIRALADYEKLSHEVLSTEAQLHHALFSARPFAEAVLAELDGVPVGFALFFPTYSTFVGKPGIHLEDLFVMPAHRGRGVGKALFAHVAGLALARECGRFEWNVLDWNEPALGFYRQRGAQLLADWRLCRLSGEALERAARLP
jgi:GNAT superfamily N-acetyltransferase